MIDRLLELKQHIVELGDVGNTQLQMTSRQWDQVEELRNLLQKAFVVTKALQLEDLTPGYFYRKWTGLKLFLEDRGGLLAEGILASVSRREKDLLDNGAILAATFVDPTHMDLLMTPQQYAAREKIVEVALRMKGRGLLIFWS